MFATPFRSHMVFAGNAGFVSIFSPKIDSLVFSREKFDSFVDVLLLLNVCWPFC